jgi:hypothetical protein
VPRTLLILVAAAFLAATAACGSTNGGGTSGGGAGNGDETCAYQFAPSAAAPAGFQPLTFQLVGSNASAECTLEIAYYNYPQLNGAQNNVQPVSTVPSEPPVCGGADDGFSVSSPYQTAIPNLNLLVHLWGGGPPGSSTIKDAVCKDPYYKTVRCGVC